MCVVIAICDLSGFSLLKRHEGIGVRDSLYTDLYLKSYTNPNAPLV